MQCPDCKFIYVSPLPSKEDIELYYNDNSYYADYTGKKWREWNIRHHYLRKLELIEYYCHKGRLLDVGCADGLFLNLAKSRGWNATGVEISDGLSLQARDNFNLQVHKGTLSSAKFPADSFDVVTFIHNLEHSPNPRSIIKEVNRILKPGGHIFVAVPNLDERIRKFIRLLPINSEIKHSILKIAGGICPPDHLCTFSKSTLYLLLRENGFSPQKYVYINRIRPWFMDTLKIWGSVQLLSLINALLRTGLHIEVLARKDAYALSSPI
jgi:SAM-dependent methyltransferase